MTKNKIKLLLLADPSSPHTVRWANSLHRKGIQVYLFGLSDYDPDEYDPEIRIETMRTPGWIKIRINGSFLKFIYITKLPRLRKVIREFNPDILHSHYVASYGLLGSLSGFHPFFISVWGIDIYLFPGVSLLHRTLVKFALKKADKIFSTSNAMAKETKKYVERDISVIPFGIDTETFAPDDTAAQGDEIVIGLVKSLERKYGIDKLIDVFGLLKKRNPGLMLKLLLVGSGSLEEKFRHKVRSMGLENDTIFTGNISHSKISDYHRQIDIAVYLSTVESFGVSVLESLSCEVPVVVSDVGGLPEVVEDGKTGLIIKGGNINDACLAIERLIKDTGLRKRMGAAGRMAVLKNYEWNDNVNQMISFYKAVL